MIDTDELRRLAEHYGAKPYGSISRQSDLAAAVLPLLDRIDALERERDELRAALQPLAGRCPLRIGTTLAADDCRQAAELLARTPTLEAR